MNRTRSHRGGAACRRAGSARAGRRLAGPASLSRAALVVASCAALLAFRPAATAPSLLVRTWSTDLAPPVYLPADSMPARRHPPDTLGTRARGPVDAGYTGVAPVVDGRLDDWRLVRWYDMAGAAAVFRGTWSGPWDFGLHFALAWNSEGLFLGGRFSDDFPSAGGGPYQPADRVTLALASEDPVVERYWMAPSRRFRFGRDGRLEAWTDLRTRRAQPFDPAALGVRAASTTSAGPGGAAGPMEFEIFVPWTAVFPLLPVADGATLVNVLVEDVDRQGEKSAAWCTVRDSAAVRASWARLEWRGGAAAPAWIVSASTPLPDPWCEWAIAGRAAAGAERSRTLELHARGIPGLADPLRAALPAGDRFLVQLGPLEAGASVWPSERRAHVDIRLPGDASPHAWDLRLPADAAVARRATENAIASIPAGASAAFPATTDVAVRLDGARQQIESMGTWFERRFHPTGVLAWRAAARAGAEALLDDAELLRRAVAAGPDSVARDAMLDGRWPHRGLGGLPTDEVFLRGHYSVLDGTVQSHALYVPSRALPHPPLVVALHDVDQDASSLFESTSLAQRCAARGWVVLCPTGRGNAGYLAAGERDVLEALAAARASLPVDGRRLYLTGLGMGGTGTWLLALRQPDLFAAASVISGYGDFDQPGLFEYLGYRPAEEAWYATHNPARLVRRGMTTAFRIVHGEHDAVISPVHARVLDARLTELGVPHEYRLDPQGDHGPRFFDDDLPATLDFFARHARSSDGVANDAVFAGVGPPIADVFARGPFAIVWGTAPLPPPPSGDEPVTADEPGQTTSSDFATAQQLAADWQAKFGGLARVLADTSVTEDMLRTTNLVLVGDPRTNRLLGRWKDRLPARYEWGLCLIGKSGYPLAKYGVLFATANPEFPERTLVVASGMQDRIQILPRSAFAVGAAWAVVSPVQGLVEIGNFEPER